MKSAKLVLLLASVLAPVHSWAQNPDEDAPPRVNLTLTQAVQTALRENLGLSIQAYGPSLAAEVEIIEESAFDPTLFANASRRKQEQDATQSTSESDTLSLGARKTFTTGTTVTAQHNLFRSEGSRFDPDLNTVIGGNLSHNADFTASVRQPLWQGRGRTVNLAALNRAKLRTEVERLSYRDEVLQTIAAVENAYWRLAYARARRELQESSIAVAQSLLEETLERERIGSATRLDVLQARANLANRQQAILESQRLVDDAQDTLRGLMGQLQPGALEDPASSMEVENLREPGSETRPLGEIWRDTMSFSPAIASQENVIEQQQLQRISSADATKPRLDLVATGATVGLSNTEAGEAYDGAFERDGHEWRLGLEFNMPWGFRAEKADLRRVEKQIDRETTRLALVKQNLYQETRRIWRTLNTSLQSLEAARITRGLEEESFEQERIKYENGLAVFRDLQEAQENLDNARIAELDAWFSALEADVSLRELDGSLLRKYGYEWQEIERTIP